VAAITLTSASGSPGVTTLAIALAHQLGQFSGRAPLVIEADPDGGVLATRHRLSLEPGLTELAGAARLGIDPADVVRYSQPLQSGIPVVVAHPSSERITAALRASAAHISTAVSSLIEHDTIIDIGRARSGSPALPLVEASSVCVLVVHPRADELVVLLHRIELLEQLAPVALVLVGSEPYGVAEVEESTGLSVLGVVPDDQGAVLADPASTRGRRSAWREGVEHVARRIAAEVGHLIDTTPVDQLRPMDEALDVDIDLDSVGIDDSVAIHEIVAIHDDDDTDAADGGSEADDPRYRLGNSDGWPAGLSLDPPARRAAG
jgi:hypothetical protein